MKLKNVSNKTYFISQLRNGRGLYVYPNQEIILFDEEVKTNKQLLKLLKEEKIIKLSNQEPYDNLYYDVDNFEKILNVTEYVIQRLNTVEGTVFYLQYEGVLTTHLNIPRNTEITAQVVVTDIYTIRNPFFNNPVSFENLVNVQVTPLGFSKITNDTNEVKIIAYDNGGFDITSIVSVQHISITVF